MAYQTKVVAPKTHGALSISMLEWAIGRFYLTFNAHPEMLLVARDDVGVATTILGKGNAIVVGVEDWLPEGIWMLVNNGGSGIIYSGDI